MAVARGSLLLFALLGLSDPARATTVVDLVDAVSQSSSLPFAFHFLNVSVGGRLHAATPFENACFSILQGQHVNVSAAACAALQANYTNPVYRVDHFGAYMLVSLSPPLTRNTAFYLLASSPQPQWETCQASTATDGCLLDSSNVNNSLAFDGVDCRLGNVPPYYVSTNTTNATTLDR